VTLEPAEIEAIAQRVAELLRGIEPPPVRYVDAARVAQVLDVEREWVYAHARQLGAFRLGGPQGRLRFDLDHVKQALAQPAAPDAQPVPAQPPGRHRRSCADRLELLPYRS
jgi:hypothetical protein